jgi:uncharacterized protein (UPF0303 family)
MQIDTDAITKQEKSLQFTSFNNDTALQIGLSLIERARAERKAITIDIMKSGQQLFHYAFAGTSPDNEQWIARKNAIVGMYFRSSLFIALSQPEHALHGGAFPIIIRGTGIVGTITVSGLTQEEDHEMAAWSISKYLEDNAKA